MTLAGWPESSVFDGCFLPAALESRFTKIGARGSAGRQSWDWIQAPDIKAFYAEIVARHAEFMDTYDWCYANLLAMEFIEHGICESTLDDTFDPSLEQYWDLDSVSGDRAVLRRADGQADPNFLTQNIYGDPDHPGAPTATQTYRLPAHCRLTFDNSVMSTHSGIYVVGFDMPDVVDVGDTFTAILGKYVPDGNRLGVAYPDGATVRGRFLYYLPSAWHAYHEPRRIYPLYTSVQEVTISGASDHLVFDGRIAIDSIQATYGGTDVSADVRTRSRIVQTVAGGAATHKAFVDLSGTAYSGPMTLRIDAETAGEGTFKCQARCSHARYDAAYGTWFCGRRNVAPLPSGIDLFPPATGECYQPGACDTFTINDVSHPTDSNFFKDILYGRRLRTDQVTAGDPDHWTTTHLIGPSIYSQVGPAGESLGGETGGDMIPAAYRPHRYYDAFARWGWEDWEVLTDGSGNDSYSSKMGHETTFSAELSVMNAFRNKASSFPTGTKSNLEKGMLLRLSPSVHLHTNTVTTNWEALRFVQVYLVGGPSPHNSDDFTYEEISPTVIGGQTYIAKITVPPGINPYARGRTTDGREKFACSIYTDHGGGLLDLTNKGVTAITESDAYTSVSTNFLMGGTNVAAPQNRRFYNYFSWLCQYGPMGWLTRPGDILKIGGRSFWITGVSPQSGDVQTVIPDGTIGYTEEEYLDLIEDFHGAGFYNWPDWKTELAKGDQVQISDPHGLLDGMGTLEGQDCEIWTNGVMLDSLSIWHGDEIMPTDAYSILVYGAEGVVYLTWRATDAVTIRPTLARILDIPSANEINALRQTIYNIVSGYPAQVV